MAQEEGGGRYWEDEGGVQERKKEGRERAEKYKIELRDGLSVMCPKSWGMAQMRGCLPSIFKALNLIARHKLDVMTHFHNPSTQKVEV